MESKYIAVFLLHALGDTLGFKNGRGWGEIDDSIRTLSFADVGEIIYNYVDLGGINGIDLKDWIISENTYYYIELVKLLLNDNKYNKLIIIKKLIKLHEKLNKYEKKDGNSRYVQINTYLNIEKYIKDGNDIELQYDKISIGTNISTRNLCIGLMYWKNEQLDELIDYSIKSSKITYMTPMGYLAGFTSAYFMSLATQNIELNKWIFMLLDILESDKIKKYIKDDLEEQKDYISYIRYWKKYLDTRFNESKPIKTLSTSNMIFRLKYYYQNFVINTGTSVIGGTGLCALIMAYDALIDCDGKYEKIIFYSMLNPGNKSAGVIASSLYGMIYGFGDVPKQLLCCLEKKEKILELAKSFFNKYY